MSAPVVPFTVHRGGKRPRRPARRVSVFIQKMERVERLNPGRAKLLEELADRILYRLRAKGVDIGKDFV